MGAEAFGAVEANRTRVCSLRSCRSTIELRPTKQDESFQSPLLLGRSDGKRAGRTYVLPTGAGLIGPYRLIFGGFEAKGRGMQA
jgi:hypothetical protein